MVCLSHYLAIATNPELTKIFQEMEISIIKLMQKLEIIPKEVGDFMEQNANSRGQMPQGMLPGMQPGMMQPGMQPGMMQPGMQMQPGMMPGMQQPNPMELLQMQQAQQFQQMMMQQQPPKTE